MKFQCPGCQVGYRIDEGKIPEKGTYIRCKKCETRFFLTRDGVQESTEPIAAPAAPPPPPDEPPPPAGVDLGDLETKLQEPLLAGNVVAAAEVMLEMVSRCARNRDFERAEACRDRMYDVTPMALNEVLKAGEIIEEEKGQAMDPAHTERWNDLYESLSPEEASTLFFSMKDLALASGETYYRQGHVNGSLCFVEAGQLNVVCSIPEEEDATAIKSIGPGEIVGTDLFFSFTVSSYFVAAKEDSQVKILDNASLLRWKESQPGIESKLLSFCERVESVSDAVVRQEIERRACQRKQSDRRATIQLLDAEGKPADQPVAAGFADVSQNGACFEVKINRREEGRKLLGGLVKISFSVDVNGTEKPLAVAGDVCAVHFHAFGDCTVHVRFRKAMNENVVDLVAADEDS